MTPNLNLWLIPVLPLVGSLVNGLFGKNFSKRMVVTVGLSFVGAAFGMALWVASQVMAMPAGQLPYIESHAPWIAVGSFVVNFNFYLDQLSMVMILVVTGVGFLIHVYSVGYMAHEGGYYRFFCYLNIFMFFMLTLVLAGNYLLMFVGWEGVGLASYLLIGFFFLKDSAANAGKKAFIVNRIGDFGFMIAMFMLITQVGSLDYQEVFAAVAAKHLGPEILTPIALLLLVGATGKSAQLPLYVWLPDAMEGPTPVSALIHAATMVTAGVYMVARSNPIFSRSPYALLAVAIVGALTALFAATIGITQTDIKRVLAYSTISQLGYMFLACGVAAYSAAIFHLMTHAFFKALLFLCAGSVIHALSGEQDMRHMGGLRKLIPWTFMTMTVGTFAIAGIPGLSGFFSKDEILWKAYSSPYGHPALWAIGLLTAGITAFYMFRLWFLTFFGERREAPSHGDAHGHGGHGVHESPWVMLAPLVLLAVLAIVGGYVGVPHAMGGENHFEKFMAPVFELQGEPASAAEAEPAEHGPAAPHGEEALEKQLAATSVAVALAGILLAWLFYVFKPGLPDLMAARLGVVYETVLHKYYVDEIYGALFVQPVVVGSTDILWKQVDAGAIDGLANQTATTARGLSERVRRMQSGNLRSYAGWVVFGAVCLMAWMLWRSMR